MSLENVKHYFQELNIEDRIKEFDVSSATVSLAAAALGCEPARIAKTMSFLVNDAAILIVMAGDTRVDNQKFKATFGTKAKMLTPEQLDIYVGHAIGGVCPFGVKEGVTIYLDEALKRFESVFPACGSSNSAIELTIPELEQYSKFSDWVLVSKEIAPSQE